MNSRVVAALLVLTAVPPLRNAERGSGGEVPLRNAERGPGLRVPHAARDSALHVLNRLAYGPRPGEVERVAAQGVLQWIDQQLEPNKIDDPVLAAREHQFKILASDRGELARQYVAAQRARRERKRERAAMNDPRDSSGAQHAAPLQARADTQPEQNAIQQNGRRLAGELQQLVVTRAAISERQLYEVMADFWTNHFNVHLAKGADRFLTPDYVEHTIRPNAMGRFEDLLIATARSPAMMFYLDNWQSVAPGTSPPDPLSAWRRGGTPGKPLPKGINENYARELLELHTLGVDGGYTQQDVIDVARVFTGWSIARPQQGASFEFHGWAHDRGEKQVLSVRFPPGHGMDEGLGLLKLLANHPATMHHLSRKLCQRFVRDDPPDGCVDDAVAAWKRSHGDIREVLRAIFHGPDFWAAETVRAKVKTPLEFVVSAVRAVGGDPDSTPRLAQVVARLGEPLYLHAAPDGYAEQEDAWVNSGALLDRMNAAVALAAGRLPGVSVDLDAVIPTTADREGLVAAADEKLLGGGMSEHTKHVIRQELQDVGDPVQARALAVGLAIGGPEFQRQ